RGAAVTGRAKPAARAAKTTGARDGRPAAGRSAKPAAARGAKAASARGPARPSPRPAARKPASRRATVSPRGRGPAPKRGSGPRGPRRPRRLRISLANPRARARGIFVVILFIFTLFGAQLLRIQAFDASATQAAALSKRLIKLHTPAMRGQILDTNGQVLADSVERFTIAADPIAIQCYVKVRGECGSQGVHPAAADLSRRLG